jgi:carboxylesterase
MTARLYADPDHHPFAFGEGPTRALLIPGFMGTPKEMRPLGEALAEAGAAVRGILLPGFGPDVERLGTVRAADWLASAGAAWNEVRTDAGRTVLVGFSMGAAVALQLAAKDPPDRLILLAPFWRFSDRRALALPLLKHVIHSFRPFEKADFTDPAVRQSFAEMAPDTDLDDPTMQARLRRETVIPTATLDELRRVSAAAGVAAQRITAPALVLQGTDDATALPRFTRHLAFRLRGPLALHELAGGHLIVASDGPSWSTVRALVTSFASAR